MSKYLKRIGLGSIIILLIISIFWWNKTLKEDKRWIYSTGTNEVVFGEVTWGMSQKEVERVVGEKLSKKSFPISGDCSLQVIKNGPVDSREIFNGNYVLTSNTKFEEEVTPHIVKKTKRLFGKPLDNFLGIQTGTVGYLFYDDKLFSVKFSPSYTLVVDNDNELISKGKLFELTISLHRRFFSGDEEYSPSFDNGNLQFGALFRNFKFGKFISSGLDLKKCEMQFQI
jgi:hypothetical protein